jgi:hypothetical protein|tara:strand:+ start:127 stop:351 length:225 start_codon:yes stop_codon:yes gene_type:complete
MEVLVAFCIVLVEAPRIDGGKSICNFWNPGVEFKSRQECMADKKLIEDYVVDEAWKLYPKAVRIYAKGLCFDDK